ncbi:hypothetical protein BASA81_004447 [Batrachochytrium salamandrivorans]|nr:hypothetical protein BASA81_004447 [Batrachochytrium salamandrivorans]
MQEIFSQAREVVAGMEQRLSGLRSELVRKDAELARLRVGTPAAPPPSLAFKTTAPNTKGVFSQRDLEEFLGSPTCHELIKFVEALAQVSPSKSPQQDEELDIDRYLTEATALVESTPPEELDPQRFGNTAFRKWHYKLSQIEFTGGEEFACLFTKSFGDPTRLDFGTGHEVAFIMLLYQIAKPNGFPPILLGHFSTCTMPKYFTLVRLLRKTYRLEPAGSHGVWSLDDYHFLPFVLGSAQLAMTPGALPPKPFLVQALQREHELEPDFFSQALLDIFRSKRAAYFAEHSPILNQLLRQEGMDWKQLHLGLIKMWVGEVLGKFPVAQHFVFGPALPITWKIGLVDHQATVILPKAQQDPTAKYFVSRKRHAPLSSSETELFSELDPETVQLGKWRIFARNEPKIGGQQEIDALGFDFPLPEMLFTGNGLELTHMNGLQLKFNCQHALRGCLDITNRQVIKVPMANLWVEKTDAEGRPIKTWREDYDWTFTSLDLMSVSKPVDKRSIRRIDYDRLKQTTEPILFFRDVCFFEDDLFDLGLSKFTVKVRVMPSLFFVLARVFVRVDSMFYRVVDTRVYHALGTTVVLVEKSIREGFVRDLPSLTGLDFAQMNDANLIASLLPIVGEVETFEVSL